MKARNARNSVKEKSEAPVRNVQLSNIELESIAAWIVAVADTTPGAAGMTRDVTIICHNDLEATIYSEVTGDSHVVTGPEVGMATWEMDPKRLNYFGLQNTVEEFAYRAEQLIAERHEERERQVLNFEETDRAARLNAIGTVAK